MYRRLLISTLIVFIINSLSLAQDTTITCKLIKKGNKKQIVYKEIIYDLYDSAAITNINKILIEYDSLKKSCEVKDKLLAGYQKIPETCTAAVAAKNEYIASLTEMMTGYKQMYKDALKLSNSQVPRFSLEAGIGASGADGIDLRKINKPVIIAGIGIKKFRTYLLLQEKNVGILIGGSLRIF